MSIPTKIEEQVTELLSSINQNLPSDMELELEGYYDRGFFVTKKRYAVINDGVITVKGLELVRRDWAPVAKKTQENVLEAILKDASPKKAKKIVKNIIDKLNKGEVENEDLVIHTKLTKKPENYKQIAPHVIAAEKLRLHGQKVTSGSIIRYIITKGKGPISKRAEPVEYIEDKEYDPEYYIQNQVLPATLRILEAIGYSEEQIMNNEKQTSLDSFF
ncbi:DNA polymerase domain-containing protein [Candidatus Methanosphaera massiliense]|jgi:DNA polymerase I|uniref:DNA polymerase domain-containing protein n=1 Tax=Methanosphaera TaxID=2316 RepID=UPI0023805563|nr:DNA polymerase domain-containing protein [Candidatus Methanosphaera massiliense]MDE4077669.1 DNA polymerase domain-containing protein [Candidatus Methanosphaera massiliense]MDY2744550.1 DNA polymerase domain-containing protein [Methanosphaera sp.]